MKHRIAMIGTRETVAGFSLLGVEIVSVQHRAQALEELFRLKRTMEIDEHGIERHAYAIVFVIEDFLQEISPEDQRKLAKGALPAIVPLPSHRGTTGYGLQRLRSIVERAVGSNILG